MIGRLRAAIGAAIGSVAARVLDGAVARALDDVDAPVESGGVELSPAGRIRALFARERVDGNRQRARAHALVFALRQAPVPIRESVMGEDEWHEAYDRWWHAHASEAGIEGADGLTR